MEVIGREYEKNKFTEIVNSGKAEFVAVYGRRRVGKTFLIKEFFNNQFTFYATGLANGNTSVQLTNFTVLLNESFQQSYNTFSNWLEAFNTLRIELVKNQEPKIIFIDELPWFDTKRSDFLTGLEAFWNSWASSQPNLKLIVCGSAASWMINKLIRNKGGLFNRITQRLKIEPFNLTETELFFKAKGIDFDRYQMINLYMVMGGIPFYLEQVRKGLSATQNIEKLCFEETGLLKSEFSFMFKSLFNNGEKHEQLLRKLYEIGSKATREQIIKKMKLFSNGDLSLKLNELEESGFIKSYTPFGISQSKKIYVIADYYTLFYLKFIEKSEKFATGSWSNRLDDSAVNVWAGLAFEQICWDHLQKIRKALGIEGIYSIASPWSKKADEKLGGTQIDLIIDRKDRVINLCEMKFSINNFTINKNYDLTLRNKIGIFKEQTQTKKSVFLTMITTFGLVKNEYAGSIVQNEITMNDLF